MQQLVRKEGNNERTTVSIISQSWTVECVANKATHFAQTLAYVIINVNILNKLLVKYFK